KLLKPCWRAWGRLSRLPSRNRLNRRKSSKFGFDAAPSTRISGRIHAGGKRDPLGTRNDHEGVFRAVRHFLSSTRDARGGDPSPPAAFPSYRRRRTQERSRV